MNGLTDGTPLFVIGYPTAWRIENVDVIYRGFEYVRLRMNVARHRIGPLTLYIRLYWGPTKNTWDLPGVHRGNGTGVRCHSSIPAVCGADHLIPGNVL